MPEHPTFSDILVRLAAIKHLAIDEKDTSILMIGNLSASAKSVGKVCLLGLNRGKENLNRDFKELINSGIDDKKRKWLDSNDFYVLNMLQRYLSLDKSDQEYMKDLAISDIKKLLKDSKNIVDFRNKIITAYVGTLDGKEKSMINNMLEFLHYENKSCKDFIEKIKELDIQEIKEKFPINPSENLLCRMKKGVLEILEEFGLSSDELDYASIIKSNEEAMEKLTEMLKNFNEEDVDKKEVDKNTEAKETEKKTEDQKTEENSTGNKINNAVSDDFLRRMMQRKRRGGGKGGY